MSSRKKRGKKGGFTNLLILSFIGLVVIGFLYLLLTPTTVHVEQQTGSSDTFTGVLVKGNLSERIEAVVTADTNCQPTGQNMITCIAIMNDSHGHELNFKYTHDMSAERCLGSGDRVIIQPTSSGSVTVSRI